MLYTKYGVDKVESNVLESAQFQNWYRSVSKKFKKNVEEGETTMVTTLTERYGDKGLAKLLYEARGSSPTAIVEQLKDAQLRGWSTAGKKSGDVFKMLQLDEAGEHLFKSPLLSSWERYSVRYIKRPEETMFSTLRMQFGDETLAKMIVAAKPYNSVATKLENVEIHDWLARRKSSDEVFDLLKLNEDTGNIMKNPAFSTWVAFEAKIIKDEPLDYVQLKLLLSYDDKRLATFIGADYTGTTAAIAAKLESSVLNHWRNRKMSPDDVFKLFLLDKAEGAKVLDSPALSHWVSYVKLLGGDPNELLLRKLNLPLR